MTHEHKDGCCGGEHEHDDGMDGMSEGSFDPDVDQELKPLPEGVKKEIITEAPSSETALPRPGDDVTVHYVGTLASDGSKFDSSRDRGQPFKFKLGQGQVIRGWDLGVATMRKGEKANFTLSSEFAHGKSGSPPKIPADATLNFEVELLSFGSELDLFGDGLVSKKVVKKSLEWQKASEGDEVVISFVWKSGAHSGEALIEALDFTMGTPHAQLPLPQATLEALLLEMKKGETASIKIASDCEHGPAGEAEVALKMIRKVDDISFDYNTKVVFKKTLAEGTGYDKASDGSAVILKVTLLDQNDSEVGPAQTVTFTVGECEHCEALECAAIKLALGETAHVWSPLAEAVTDAKLGAQAVPAKFLVTMVQFDKGKEAWSLSAEEKLARAVHVKEVAGRVFQSGRVHLALERYKSVTKMFENATGQESTSETKALARVCELNKAMCFLKLEEWRSAEQASSKVLKQEPSNVKALYRRAQALLKLAELEGAEADLKRVLELDAANADARRLLVSAKDLIRKQNSAMKGLYAKMMQGTSAPAATAAEPTETNARRGS